MNKILLIFSISVLAISFSVAQNQGGYLEVRGTVLGNWKTLSGVKVNVMNNNVSIDNLVTTTTGKFVFHFDYNFVFTVEFSKEGYKTKSIVIDTHVPENEKSEIGYFEFKIDLFVPDTSDAKSSDVPLAKISFDNKDRMFNYSESLFYDLGVEKFGLKEYEEAIKYFSRSINAKIKLVDSYYNRGVCYKKMGDTFAACNDWQNAKNLGDKESEKLLLKYCGTKEDTTKIVEVMPEFPGGKEEALLKYIYANLKYPKEAREKNIQGTVYVSFIINNMGKVEDSKILKGIGNGCDEEALRLVNSMPDWKPGTQNGKPVSVQYNLPIKFEL